MSRAALFACIMLLAACSGKPKDEADDFGAALTARAAAAADRACEAAGFEDLHDCTEAPAQEARRAAKTALSMTETYTRLCTPDLGRQRCDDMLMAAYYSAKK